MVLTVSHDLEDRLRSAGIGPVRVIPPFADAPPEPDSPPGGDDVVYAGRLAASKGIDVLLDAFAAVHATVPSARLRIAGDGPEAPRLRASTHPRDAVRWEGLLTEDDTRALLTSAAVVVIPSTAPEGLPSVAVEALLAGRPVVATDHPSLRELLRDGLRGFLVPPDDSAALADALCRVLTDRARAEAVGRAARQWATRELSTGVGVARVVEAYREALARGG
jgi:glycosyltransferase involved in cell wall biosynthesis